jgi:hypothetical protein
VRAPHKDVGGGKEEGRAWQKGCRPYERYIAWHESTTTSASTGGDMSQLSDQTERIFLGTRYLDKRLSSHGGVGHQWAQLPEHESFLTLARAGCRWRF